MPIEKQASSRSTAVAEVTNSIARIEQMLPKVIEQYQQKNVGSSSSNSNGEATQASSTLVLSLREEIKKLSSEVGDLRSENIELAGALEELHEEYTALLNKKHGHSSPNTPSSASKEVKRLLNDNEKLRSELHRLQKEVVAIKESAANAVNSLKAAQKAKIDMHSSSPRASSPSKTPTGNSSPLLPPPPPLLATFTNTKTPKHSSAKLVPESRRVSAKVRSFEAAVMQYNATEEKLSPVVEERLLFTVFDKYKAEASGLMPLSRLIRFAKEFGIIPGGQCEQLAPMLVAGDIDVLYKVSLLVKTDAVDANKKLSHHTYHQHFLAYRRNPKAVNYSATSLMNVNQFIQVMREVANRLYVTLIEQQTGTSLDYLPPSQREIASRAAMEVMVQQKIIPVADKMGLIPWPLFHLDRTLSLMTGNSQPYQLLATVAEQLETWFLRYIPTTGSQNTPDAVNRAAVTANKNWGLAYRSMTRFSHDVGIVPTLLTEPQLYSLFEEVLRCANSNPAVLWHKLPEELRVLDLAQFEIQLRSIPGMNKTHLDPESPLNCLGILSFSLLLATIATQVFPTVNADYRLTKFFEWIEYRDAAVN